MADLRGALAGFGDLGLRGGQLGGEILVRLEKLFDLRVRLRRRDLAELLLKFGIQFIARRLQLLDLLTGPLQFRGQLLDLLVLDRRRRRFGLGWRGGSRGRFDHGRHGGGGGSERSRREQSEAAVVVGASGGRPALREPVALREPEGASGVAGAVAGAAGVAAAGGGTGAAGVGGASMWGGAVSGLAVAASVAAPPGRAARASLSVPQDVH